jgi:hypothetical protein
MFQNGQSRRCNRVTIVHGIYLRTPLAVVKLLMAYIHKRSYRVPTYSWLSKALGRKCSKRFGIRVEQGGVDWKC